MVCASAEARYLPSGDQFTVEIKRLCSSYVRMRLPVSAWKICTMGVQAPAMRVPSGDQAIPPGEEVLSNVSRRLIFDNRLPVFAFQKCIDSSRKLKLMLVEAIRCPSGDHSA